MTNTHKFTVNGKFVYSDDSGFYYTGVGYEFCDQVAIAVMNLMILHNKFNCEIDGLTIDRFY